MNTKLTKRTVDAAHPANRDTFIWDAGLKGFGLKVTPKGKRVYVLQYRFGGRTRRYTIGQHGSPWTPDHARDEAFKLLGQVADGIDPMAQKTLIEKDLTVRRLCDRYFAERCHVKKPSTIAVEQGLARRHIEPLLGGRLVRSLTRPDVERFVTDVAKGKTAVDVRTGKHGRAIVKGGKGTAKQDP